MSSLDDSEVLDSAAGDSAEQRRAEEYLVEHLGNSLNVNLKKRKFKLPGRGWLEVDGVCDSPPVLCEAWVHVGPAKSAQKNTVLADTLKLLYVERINSAPARKILLFGDSLAARRFKRQNWMGSALEHFGIEIQVIELPDAIREEVTKAQKRQLR